MPAQSVTYPRSAQYLLLAAVVIGVCAFAGAVFGNGVAGALVGLAVVLLLVVAVKRADRRHRRVRR